MPVIVANTFGILSETGYCYIFSDALKSAIQYARLIGYVDRMRATRESTFAAIRFIKTCP